MPRSCKNRSRRFSSLLAAIFSAALSSAVHAGEVAEPFGDVRSRVQVLLDGGDYQAAAAAAEALPALARTPQEAADAAILRGKSRYQLSDHKAARDLLLDAVRLSVAADGEGSQRQANALTSLGAAYRGLAAYDEAEATYRRALTITEALADARPERRADLLTSLGVLRFYRGDLGGAETLTLQALSIRRTLPEKAPLAQALDNLGTILQSRGLLVPAEPLLEEALALRKGALRAGHPDIATSLNNVGVLRHARGDFRGAEKAFREAISIDVGEFGDRDPQVLTDLQNLAESLRSLRQLDEARDVHLRVLALRRENVVAQGGDAARDFDLAISHGNLANALLDMGEEEAALANFEAALAIDRTRTAENPSRDVPLTLNNMAGLHLRRGQVEEAIGAFLAALEGLRPMHLADDPLQATVRFGLASARAAQGDLPAAESLLRESIDRRRRLLPGDHPELLSAEARLAAVLARSGKIAEAVARTASVLAAIRARMERATLASPIAHQEAEARLARRTLEDCLLALAASSGPSGRMTPELEASAFEAVAISQASATAAVVGRAAMRRYLARPDLAGIARDLDTAVERRELAARRDARAAAGLETAEAPSDLETVEVLDARIQSLRSRLPARFVAEATPRLPELGEVRRSASKEEALLGFVVGETSLIVLDVSAGELRLATVPIGRDALKDRIDDLRVGLTWSDDRNAYPEFDLGKARAFGDLLLGKVEDRWGDVRRLAVVPDGPLSELPLGILVRGTVAGDAGAAGPRRYQTANWLGDRYAITVFPDFGSLASLRRSLGPVSASSTFVGFGNPKLAPVVRTTSAEAIARLLVLQGTSPGLDGIRALPSLPETRRQLEVMNSLFGNGSGTVIEDVGATETAVKGFDFSGYRYIAFATHGLQPADTGMLAEPALVLTPPVAPASGDDGLLTASEIAGLAIDADLVLLSACNTASPRRGYGADGLSGIARAFFQAGARSVLISHWQVEAYATVALLEALARSDASSLPEALAEAAQAVRHVADGRFAHPGFWAPFTLVGDTGRLPTK